MIRGVGFIGSPVLRRALLAVLLPAALLGCGDDGDDVGSGDGTAPRAAEPVASFEGTITQVTPFEPVTDGCVDAADLDPDGSVSSDDPPICTDADLAPLGSILVEVEPGTDGGEKIVFTVPRGAPVTRDGDEITFADLAEGDLATIGFDGQVAESYPGQATAAAVDVRA
jgi:hypothetical protein